MIIHILADGSRTSTITGHVIKPEEAPDIYKVVQNITRRLDNEKKNTTKN